MRLILKIHGNHLRETSKEIIRSPQYIISPLTPLPNKAFLHLCLKSLPRRAILISQITNAENTRSPSAKPPSPCGRRYRDPDMHIVLVTCDGNPPLSDSCRLGFRGVRLVIRVRESRIQSDDLGLRSKAYSERKKNVHLC